MRRAIGRWLCRHGFHDFGWAGPWAPEGKLYRCEREDCDVEYWGRP